MFSVFLFKNGFINQKWLGKFCALQKPLKLVILACTILLLSIASVNAAEVEVNKSSVGHNQDHFIVYLSAHGDDENDGLSITSPVLSLQKAHDILLDYLPQRPVDIIVNSGTYYFQQVKWRYTNGHAITFRAYNETIERPIFDGLLVSENWFVFRGSQGESSNLKFRHIKVQNYNVAMTFKGNRENTWGWNGGNELYSMYFYRIGGMYYSAKHSTAAVRFVNSRNNKIRNSHFVEILNRADKAHLIHPVYLAHYSSNNIVEKNRFLRSNGNPIAVRDSSNFNVIKNNKFIDAGNKAIYQDWYCVKGKDKCTKQVVECPSIGNVFTGNEIASGYYGEIGFFDLYYDSEYCGPAYESRLRTSVNTRK